LPVYRDWGNFTVDLGNTTWNIDNVYFDTPDTTGYGYWSANTSPTHPPSDAPDAA
jgi:hypothetical protein